MAAIFGCHCCQPARDHTYGVAAVLLLTTLTSSGCRDPDAARAAANQASPRDVIAAVNDVRRSGRYQQLDNYLAPGQAGRHVPILLAIDQVLAANRALQKAGAERFGRAAMFGYDVELIGDYYGVLSMQVHAVRETVTGEEAVVMVQEGDHVPLQPVRLIRQDGGWRLMLEDPEPGLAERLNKLAGVLDDIRGQLDRKIQSVVDLRTAYRYRVWPIIEAIAEADESSG